MDESQNAVPFPDRRKHIRVREAFPEVCRLLAPLMGGIRQGQISDFALSHIVHDQFPGMSGIDLEILIIAIRRYCLRTGPN